MREVLRSYFKQFDTYDDERLPQMPVPDDATPGIFVGAEEDGWVRWRPREKDEFFDLSELENNAKISIPQSIKDFMNSWWFGDLDVQFGENRFAIDPIIPGNYRADFYSRLLGYKRAHQGRLEYIPIGICMMTGDLLVVEIKSGKVCTEEFDAGEYRVISNDLEEFFESGN
ncbi:hypothetical protein HR51_19615 [Burkholderia cepacia]|nr:hypothetical protein HR51_19615 [Burkholderia cepacia]